MNAANMWKTILLLLCFGSIIARAAGPVVKPCSGKKATIQCLVKNFDLLYKNDYDSFFRIFNVSKNNVEKCTSPGDLTSFLAMGSMINGNAEVGEAYNEVIEELFRKDSRCVLLAARNLSANNLCAFSNRLFVPLYTKLTDIQTALLKHVSDVSLGDTIKTMRTKCGGPRLEPPAKPNGFLSKSNILKASHVEIVPAQMSDQGEVLPIFGSDNGAPKHLLGDDGKSHPLKRIASGSRVKLNIRTCGADEMAFPWRVMGRSKPTGLFIVAGGLCF